MNGGLPLYGCFLMAGDKLPKKPTLGPLIILLSSILDLYRTVDINLIGTTRYGMPIVTYLSLNAKCGGLHHG